MKTNYISNLSLISWLMILSSQFVLAGTVTKISNKKVVVEFKNEAPPQAGSKVTILDQGTHEEIGTLEIIKVKDSRALGLLKSGTAKPGDTADILSSNSQDQREPAKDNSNEILGASPKVRKKISRITYGVGAELINTQMMLKKANNSGTLDGNGFGIRGVVEYAFTPSWILLGSVGLHPLVMTSNVSDLSSFNTNYLGTEAIVRYAFSKRTEGLWLGGGGGYYLTMSSNINPKPANEFVIIGSTGYNMRIAKSYFSLKGDLIMFQSKKSGDYTYQAFQFAIGGVYFF